VRGERWLLRVGELLVGRAARHMPPGTREQRYQEWVAELPVILGDPGIRSAAARAARMLWFAADTVRGASVRPGRSRGAHRGGAGKTVLMLGVLVALVCLPVVLIGGLAFVVFVGYQTVSKGSVAGDLTYFLSVFLGPVVLSLWRWRAARRQSLRSR
jgi:hypothetical protein